MGAGMNIIPLLVYDDVLQLRALTDLDVHVVLLDQTTRRIEGFLDDIYLTVGGSYVTADFVILNTDHDPKAPIILGRPFLHTIKPSIYVGRIYYYVFWTADFYLSKWLEIWTADF
jgi:hypothetical protein